MKNICLTACLGMSLAAFAPAFVHADGVALNVNLGADDSAHFDFGAGPGHPHEPHIFKAAQACQQAKHILWNTPRRGPAKTRAIYQLNQALDQLRWLENHPHDPHRHDAVFQATSSLRQARKALWHGRRGGAKADAISYIDGALGQLNWMQHRY